MMNNKLIAVALVGLMLLVLPAGAATQVSSVTIRGTVAQENGTHPFDIYNMSNDTDGAVSWNPQTFAGFYYDLKHGYGKEKLSISQNLSNDDRTIQENNLVYTTGGNEKQLKVVDKAFNGNNTAARNAGLENFGNNEMGAVEGNYTIVGWQAQKYVAINDKLNKLVKLHYEQGSSDKRTLTVGETWDLGAGWTLSAQSIDAKATPRQVWLVLSKNGVKVEDKVVGQGKIFTYSGDLGGESDVPQFVTYIDSVFAGATTDMVQLKYTWVLDTSVTHIKTGNDYGVLRVKVANSTLIQLNNSETTVSLDKDSTVNIMGDMKFKVADSDSILRFYPEVVKTEPGTYEIRGTVAQENGSQGFDIYNMSNDTDGAVSWNPQTFAGFYYDLKHGYGKEKLSISQSLSNDDRTIQENNLVYTTGGNEKQLKVVDKAFNGNNTAAINAGLENFGNNEMGAVEGNYTIVGWQAQKYVAINDKLNKLVKLHYEQGSSDKRTLTIGETWDLGAGWTLSAQSIDAKATPRQVWLVLSKNGVKVEDKVVGQGKIFTYSGDLGGESDVPQFVTYIDSVFAGATTDMVQLKYTWVLDTSVTHIKTGNDYGVLRVKVANSTLIQLNNSETTVSLDKDSTVNIMGNMKFKVADSDSILRFYPMVEYEIPAAGPTTTGTVTATGTATGTATATATGTAVATATGTAVATGTAATTATATGTAAATATPKSPGFEAIFAIAGLLAVSFLVLRQRK